MSSLAPHGRYEKAIQVDEFDQLVKMCRLLTP